MLDKKDLEKYVEGYLQGSDKFLVELHIKPGNVVNIFIDSDTAITISDCVGLSRYIESKYNRDVVDFELNVSSAGLDHPFSLPRQYMKYINKSIMVITNEGKKIKGILREFDGQTLKILEEKTKKVKEEVIINISISEVKEAKAVISFN